VRRGEVWWATLGEPTGSGPGYRRPVVVVQANEFNASRIRTVVVAAVTTNMERALAPGNVRLARRMSRLPKDSVVNVSQVLTLDRSLLAERVAMLPERAMFEIDAGLRLVLAL
jgi:mRNA interferase MazF